jgi:alpha-amylase
MVMTDRFARDDPPVAVANATACAGRGWCGGTLRAILPRLDYIQRMGFDALWLTPVVLQVPWLDRWNGTGYHGYWARDFFKIDPHFGTEDDLLALSAALHQRGMLLMLDVVANHVGPLHSVAQIQSLGPGLIGNVTPATFPPQLHQLGRRTGETCQQYLDNPVEMTDAGPDCWPNYNLSARCNYTVLLQGWFGDLGDLNQDDAPTRAYLLRWIGHMVQHYALDGLRLDTALYMKKPFLRAFQDAAGVLMLGELVMDNHVFHRSFVRPRGPLSSALNFPLANHLKRIFSRAGSLTDLRALLDTQDRMQYPAHGALLGNFVDNHDSARFLFNHSDEGAAGSLAQLQNALTFVMLWQGLPIVWQGTEQVAVSNASDTRTSMWGAAGSYGETALTRFVGGLNRLRAAHGLGFGGANAMAPGRVVSATRDALVFVRGGLMVQLNNNGGGGGGVHCMMLEDLPVAWRAVEPRGPLLLERVVWSSGTATGATTGATLLGSRLCVPRGEAGGGPVVFRLVALSDRTQTRG